ncbi:MAG: hypothetical protein JRJ12_09765 [Deltaproteobacteria bacterium]|nr:hypothetical protein [Deltaproteobacteria bacterium]
MSREAETYWHRVAWYGMEIEVPGSWEVSRLGRRYFQLDDGDGPVFELKWWQPTEVAGPEVYLKKLARQWQKAWAITFEQQELPGSRHPNLPGFEAAAFVWQKAELRGQGVIVSCGTCGRVTLMQFYERQGSRCFAWKDRVLSSFRDHWQESFVPWAVYGIRLSVPECFELLDHQFQPGHYCLHFRCGREELLFSRWSPANVLLRDNDFQQWFVSILKDSRHIEKNDVKSLQFLSAPCLQWQHASAAGWLARLRTRIKKASLYRWVRVWHLLNKNQIIGVEGRSLQPLNLEFLDEMCRNYEVI